MFNGLDKYRLNGRSILTARTQEAAPRGYVKRGSETARQKETASAGNTSTSSMVLGGVTDDDISLSYIGGSSNAKGGGGGGKSQIAPEIYKYYQAMFREDSICGPAIELRANIPYGDFVLSGVDKVKLQAYDEACNNMRLRTMMPRIAIDRDVQGAYLGLLDWNSEKKTYDSMLPYSRQFVSQIIYPGVHGMDPVIDIELSGMLEDIVNSDDQRLAAIKKCIPSYLQAEAKGGKAIPVPMDSVVWIDRPAPDPRFNSILHRILPVFLIERALTRGTIEAAHRRQRGILHITAGSGDLWLASPEEMSAIAQLFNDADADPLGAIVVTREGISPNEVRNPTDFWRVTDSFDQTSAFKLRALGISESFLSGDATFNNAEVAISTFISTVKTERGQVTEQLFDRKIFPQIAEAKGFKIAGRERGISQEERMETAIKVAKLVHHGMEDVAREVVLAARQKETAANAANSILDISMYDMPKVAWKQSLMPEGDAAYIQLLNDLADRGVPPPIRAMFAAGGLDFDNIMDNQKADIADRAKLKAYVEQIRENSPPPPPMPGEDGGGADEFARFVSRETEVGLLDRAYEDREQYEPYTEGSGGKKSRPITSEGKRYLRDKQHKALGEALARHADNHNRQIRSEGEYQ